MALLAAIRRPAARAMRAGLLALADHPRIGFAATRLPGGRATLGRFVAGEALDDALVALRDLAASGRRTTVDVLGESVASLGDAQSTAREYVRLVDALAVGGLERNVSLKLTAFGLAFGEDACLATLEPVLERAAATGTFVRFDMEDSGVTEATLRTWRRARERCGDMGPVIQAALRRSAGDVEALIAERARVRLCKGAYAEPASAAFQSRADVDAAYERLMVRLLDDGTYPGLATHDPSLIERAVRHAERSGYGRDHFEFQMLYGVRRDLQRQLVEAGWTVRVYVPFGACWYPYLLRRLAERPANVAMLIGTIAGEARSRRP